MRLYEIQHSYYCGVDLHARSLFVNVLDDTCKTREAQELAAPLLCDNHRLKMDWHPTSGKGGGARGGRHPVPEQLPSDQPKRRSSGGSRARRATNPHGIRFDHREVAGQLCRPVAEYGRHRLGPVRRRNPREPQ